MDGLPFRELQTRGFLKVCSSIQDPVWQHARHMGLMYPHTPVPSVAPAASTTGSWKSVPSVLTAFQAITVPSLMPAPPPVPVSGEGDRAVLHPCVVLASHSSLRFGDALALLPLFLPNQRNAIVLTDPDYPAPAALLPWAVGGVGQPRCASVLVCPVDGRLTAAETNALLARVAPRHVLAPRQWCVEGAGAVETTAVISSSSTASSSNTEAALSAAALAAVHQGILVDALRTGRMAMSGASCQVTPFSHGNRISVPMPAWVTDVVPISVVRTLWPRWVNHLQGGTAIATPWVGDVVAHGCDGYHHVSLATATQHKRHGIGGRQILYGSTTVEALLSALQSHGIHDAVVAPPSTGHLVCIRLPSLGASLLVAGECIDAVVDSLDNVAAHTLLEQVISKVVSCALVGKE